MNDFSADFDSRPKEVLVPEKIYYNFPPQFASLIFTIPNLEVILPENPNLTPQGDLSIAVLNNGRMQADTKGYQGLSGKDWSQKTKIDSVQWQGETIEGLRLLRERKQLLNEFLTQTFGGIEQARQMRTIVEAAGLRENSYLYRAIRKDELRRIDKDGSMYFSHLDPSANFESEEMYNGARSQVKHFANEAGDYSGNIIRWKIEEPLLYRTAGTHPQRVIPMLSHYLPQDLEVSKDGGKTFQPAFSTPQN